MENNLLNKITKLLDDKKAKDITELEVKNLTTIADYFVVATGTSSTHIQSLADYVEEELKKEDITPNKVEGRNSGNWILMDYNDAIVHIFTEEERQHYNLDELWDQMKNRSLE